MIDSTAWELDLMPQFKCDRTQSQSFDDLRIESLQK
jgi:hypothetical protein